MDFGAPKFPEKSEPNASCVLVISDSLFAAESHHENPKDHEGRWVLVEAMSLIQC